MDHNQMLTRETHLEAWTNWQTPCQIVGGRYTLQFLPKTLSTAGEFQLVLKGEVYTLQFLPKTFSTSGEFQLVLKGEVR